jgi:hypothetical protein
MRAHQIVPCLDTYSEKASKAPTPELVEEHARISKRPTRALKASGKAALILGALLAAGSAEILQGLGDWHVISRALGQGPTRKDVAPGQVSGRVVSETDYEISLPTGWSKLGQSDGKWEFHSTKRPDRLNIHVRVFNPAVRTDEIERVAWKFFKSVMSTTAPKHAIVQSGWEGTTFSVIGVGISVDDKVLLATRFIVGEKKIVSAVYTIPVEAVSLEEYPALERQRLGLLKSLKLR